MSQRECLLQQKCLCYFLTPMVYNVIVGPNNRIANLSICCQYDTNLSNQWGGTSPEKTNSFSTKLQLIRWLYWSWQETKTLSVCVIVRSSWSESNNRLAFSPQLQFIGPYRPCFFCPLVFGISHLEKHWFRYTSSQSHTLKLKHLFFRPLLDTKCLHLRLLSAAIGSTVDVFSGDGFKQELCRDFYHQVET